MSESTKKQMEKNCFNCNYYNSIVSMCFLEGVYVVVTYTCENWKKYIEGD